MLRFLAILQIAAWAADASAQVKYVGSVEFPASAEDLSGLTGNERDGTPKNRLGGLGSGIAYSGVGDRYIMLCDRGPADGDSDYRCRWHEVRIDPKRLSIKLVATKLLSNSKGKPLVGSFRELNDDPAKTRRFDPEGIRVGPMGRVWLSDEYGPSIVAFDPDGKELKRLMIPAKFLPAKYSAKASDEFPPNNAKGRQPNRGFEGLAISPNGKRLLAVLQSPLIQDHGLDAQNERVGRNCRILDVSIESGKSREWVYPMESAGNGVCEILAAGGARYLVLERDGKGGKEAKLKKIFLIDLDGATDVSDIDSLPEKELPAKIKPVKKKLFLDLMNPAFGLAGEKCPEKVEGICFGPALPDGKISLLVSIDNDLLADVPTKVLVFSVDPNALPGYNGPLPASE